MAGRQKNQMAFLDVKFVNLFNFTLFCVNLPFFTLIFGPQVRFLFFIQFLLQQNLWSTHYTFFNFKVHLAGTTRAKSTSYSKVAQPSSPTAPSLTSSASQRFASPCSETWKQWLPSRTKTSYHAFNSCSTRHRRLPSNRRTLHHRTIDPLPLVPR